MIYKNFNTKLIPTKIQKLTFKSISKSFIMILLTHKIKALGIKGPAFENGKIIDGYYDAVYKPLIDNNDHVTDIMAVAIDVTEKKLAMIHEQELNEEVTTMNEELTYANEDLETTQTLLLTLNRNLAESESRFRNLIKVSPMAIVILKGRELIIDSANNPILNITKQLLHLFVKSI